MDPVNGGMMLAPPGYVDDDPYQYKYLPLCDIDRDGLDTGCELQVNCEPRTPGGKRGEPVQWQYAPKTIANPAWSDWQPQGGPSCIYDPDPQDVLRAIAARIANDFKQLPIQSAKVTVQPGPHTLKGMETNVFAAATEQAFDVVILGQNVHLVATPVEYTYNYGDGTSFGPTMFAGGSISEDEWGTKTRTSHVYKQTGDFRLSVTTGFRGTYSVNGGPPLPITGNGQFASPAQLVSVWRSETRQVADNCIENPTGWACPGSNTAAK
ncbi:PKD domain-containing protein [Arthrobacter cupressi]